MFANVFASACARACAHGTVVVAFANACCRSQQHVATTVRVCVCTNKAVSRKSKRGVVGVFANAFASACARAHGRAGDRVHLYSFVAHARAYAAVNLCVCLLVC